MKNNRSTVLIVDDEPSLVEAIREKLSHGDYDILTANDGKAGLKLARDKHPDIIIIDQLMPKMDGLTVIETIRETAWGKDIPVIMFTNVDGSDFMYRSIRDGAQDYMIKADVSLNDLYVAVQERLA